MSSVDYTIAPTTAYRQAMMRGDVLNDLLLMREHVQVIRTAFPWKDEHKKEFNFLLKNCDWEKYYPFGNRIFTYPGAEYFKSTNRSRGFFCTAVLEAISLIEKFPEVLHNALIDSGEQRTLFEQLLDVECLTNFADDTSGLFEETYEWYKELPANIKRLEILAHRLLLEAANDEFAVWLPKDGAKSWMEDDNDKVFAPSGFFMSYTKLARNMRRGYIKSPTTGEITPLKFNTPYRIARYEGDLFPDIVEFVKDGMEALGVIGLTPFDIEVQAASITLYIENQNRGGAPYQTDKQLARVLRRSKENPSKNLIKDTRESMDKLGGIRATAKVCASEGQDALTFTAPLVTPYVVSRVSINGNIVDRAYCYPNGIAPFLWEYHRVTGNKQFRLIPYDECIPTIAISVPEKSEEVGDNTRNSKINSLKQHASKPTQQTKTLTKIKFEYTQVSIAVDGYITQRIEEVRRAAKRGKQLSQSIRTEDLYMIAEACISKKPDPAKKKEWQRQQRALFKAIFETKKDTGVIKSYRPVQDKTQRGCPITAFEFEAIPYSE